MSETAVERPARAHVESRDVRDSDAEYALEYAVACPACGSTLKTVKVVRLLRTRVNFVSTLPRHGQVVICPDCRAILSGALALI